MMSLVERACQGDRTAFAHLLAGVRRRMWAVAIKVLNSDQDADDAVQVASLKAWRSIQTFDGRSTFSTWMHVITHRAALDLRRRRQREHLELLGETHEPSHEETGERACLRAETDLTVNQALAALGPKGSAVKMFMLENRSYQEIAKAMGVPIGTVMSRLFYARRKLADVLREAA